MKEQTVSVSITAMSGVVTLYLFLIGNPAFVLTLLTTVLQVANSLPKNADIVLVTKDIGVGTLKGQDTNIPAKLDFFNRGKVAGQLLSISKMEGVESPYCEVYAMTHDQHIGNESFPIQIDANHHGYVRIWIQFNRKAPGPPPVFQMNLNIQFVISARKGMRAQRISRRR